MRLHEFTQDILESPQTISPSEFGFDVDTVNHSQAQRFLSGSKCVKVGQIKGFNLYKNGNSYALIDDADLASLKMHYYVQYINKWMSTLKTNSIQQVLVWVRKGSQYSGIAATLFFDYLLKETGCIVTDAYQTPDGERFWGNMIANALSSGLNVYALDIMPPNKKIEPILNMNELSAIKHNVWGSSDRNQERRVIITNKTFAPLT